MTDDNHKEILHQLGAEIVSSNRIASIIDDGGICFPVYCYDIFFSLYNVWM